MPPSARRSTATATDEALVAPQASESAARRDRRVEIVLGGGCHRRVGNLRLETSCSGEAGTEFTLHQQSGAEDVAVRRARVDLRHDSTAVVELDLERPKTKRTPVGSSAPK